MTADFAHEIKERLTAREVLEHYGIRVNRAGFAKCPFHSGGAERTGSFKVYNGNRGWTCFGCGSSGSVIDFVMKYFNLSFRDAIKKLNNDFNLGLPIDGNLSEADKRRIRREEYERRKEMERRKKRREAALNAYYAALDRYTYFDGVISKHGLDGDSDGDSDEFNRALREIEIAKYQLDEAEAYLHSVENE